MYRGNVRDGSLSLSEAEFATAVEDKNALVIRAPQMEGAVILLRLPDANYRALSAVCTHQGCEVRPSTGGLQCPCHGSAYSLEGAVLRGPAKEPLPVYPVHVADGRITIDVRAMELR
jgi:Rieske Fe-S protein